VQDEVDAIVHAWRRERPDVDTEPLQVMSRISRLAGVLADRRTEAFAEYGLQAHEFDVLSALRRAGAPFELTAGELSGITHVTSGTMTSRLDRLSARALVSRRADPRDGRLVRVRLTHRGREYVDAAFVALLRSEHELLARVSVVQRRALADGLRQLLLAAERTTGTTGTDG
jgi:DNA-binding MarR family transcriptional regulator